MTRRRIHRYVVLLWTVLTSAALQAASFTSVGVGNVTTTAFAVSWQTDQSTIPGVEVFADAGGTQSLAGQLRVEAYPLETDRLDVETSVEIREAGRALRDEMRVKQVVLVKVSGLQPATQYFVRPAALDESGAVIDSGDLLPVTTAQTTGFVGESQQVELDLSGLDYPGAPVAGTIMSVSTPEARYPLFAVVGDSWSPNRAYIDLTRFLNAAGDRNLEPSGVLPLAITWLGLPDTPGEFVGPDVDYDGALVVARVNRLVFDVTETDVSFVITFAQSPAVVGLPLQFGVEAQDSEGLTLTEYERSAVIGSTGTLTVGEGVTAPLTAGLLGAHTVVFAAPGQVELTVGDPLGGAESSAPIEVLPLSYDAWRAYYFGNTTDPDGEPDANPDGDELTNEGEYVTLQHPGRSSPAVFRASRTAGGMTVSLDFNRFQSEYRVRFQTSTDLQQWNDSAIAPEILESLSDRDIMGAFFPAAEFGDEPFGAVRVVYEKIPPVVVTSVSLDGMLLTVDFTGESGVTGWRVMGSVDLVTFPYDRTADSTITELAPGQYQAVVDLSVSSPATYFVRIER